MIMLKMYEYDDLTCEKCIAVLDKASNVKITQELNGAYELSFSYPLESEKLVCENRLVVCEGQTFRIMKTNRASDGRTILNVECLHIYNADSQAIHLQNVPDFIGCTPYDVLEYVFSNTPFTLIDDEELEELGLNRVDYDGFLIDFFTMDKTTPFEVVNTVIENCGKGEIYVDNLKVALVERIGKETDVRLDLTRNLQNITIERDISGLVTRLYPYGYEDLHIGSVNGNVQYIESENISKYGVREGFKDYSDYKNPTDVLNRALWEMSSDNADRIDVPSVNISGSLVDLSKLSEYSDFMKINIGDTVTVIDGDVKISERIIRLESYPYEPLMGEVSIGRVRKDLFFYLNQMGKIGKNYNKVSTTSGKVSAAAISGVVSADGVKVKDSSGSVSVLTDMISMSDSDGVRFSCGISNGEFVFCVYDGVGKALYLTDDRMNIRGYITADKLSIGGVSITSNGTDLYIAGKKIKTE